MFSRRRLTGVFIVAFLLWSPASARAGARHGVVNRGLAAGAHATGAPAVVGALQPVDMNNGTSAAGLASSIVGNGVAVSNVVYTGAQNAAAMFTGGTGIVGFEQGIILSTGSTQTTTASVACGNPGAGPGYGVEGPNVCDWTSTMNNTPGDPILDALAGYETFDAARLDFDFVPQYSTAQFRYVFTSEEYNEYANTVFNDVFAFLVNDTNCALVPGTALPVDVDTINGGNPLGTDPQNAQYYINNDLDDGGGAINTEMDGLTTVLTCDATVTPNATNHMTLMVADGSDQILDTNVFIEGGSFVSGTQVATTLSGGGSSGAFITVPPGTDVADQATLQGVGHETASGTVKYQVYSDSACSTLYAPAGRKTVVNGEVAGSKHLVLNAAGKYYWVAKYSGDGVHNAATSPCGSEIVTVKALTDTAAPTCTTVRLPGEVHFNVRDTNSGLKSIVLDKAVNATLTIPPFTPGTTEPVVLVAVKNGPGKANVEFRATDVDGNSRICDKPVRPL